MEITKKEEERILRKQCSMVGIKFEEFFKPYLNGKPMPKDWYSKHTWTSKQEKEFKKWLTKFCLRKFKGLTKRYVKNMVGMWVLDYGWRTE